MLAYLVSQANLARLVGSLEPSIFALQLSFTAEQFWRVVSAWGAAGVQRYMDHFPYDFLHPLVYGCMGVVWVRDTRLFEAWPAGLRRFWAWSLPVAAMCDLLENVLHIRLLTSGPGSGSSLVLIAGAAASCKWLLAVLFTLALGAGAVRSWRPFRGP